MTGLQEMFEAESRHTTVTSDTELAAIADATVVGARRRHGRRRAIQSTLGTVGALVIGTVVWAVAMHVATPVAIQPSPAPSTSATALPYVPWEHAEELSVMPGVTGVGDVSALGTPEPPLYSATPPLYPLTPEVFNKIGPGWAFFTEGGGLSCAANETGSALGLMSPDGVAFKVATLDYPGCDATEIVASAGHGAVVLAGPGDESTGLWDLIVVSVETGAVHSFSNIGVDGVKVRMAGDSTSAIVLGARDENAPDAKFLEVHEDGSSEIVPPSKAWGAVLGWDYAKPGPVSFDDPSDPRSDPGFGHSMVYKKWTPSTKVIFTPGDLEDVDQTSWEYTQHTYAVDNFEVAPGVLGVNGWGISGASGPGWHLAALVRETDGAFKVVLPARINGAANYVADWVWVGEQRGW